MVEPQFVVLDVAGSSPVGHPTFLFAPVGRYSVVIATTNGAALFATPT